MNVKELPNSERPYEKLEMYGESSLSNAELLAIIIKTGTRKESSIDVARKVLNLNENDNSLRFMQDLSIQEFMGIKGIGKVKAIQLKAICELAKRMARPINSMNVKINLPQDVANLLMDELRYEKREIAKVVILNNKNRVLKIVNISLGGSNFTVLSPKDVLQDAIKMGAPRIILIHNHPSGDPTPSKGDFLVTDRIYDSADVMGIELLDHIVIGDGKFESIMSIKKFSN